MMQFIRKIKLLCWKNLIIRKRHYIATCFEVLFPIIVYALLAYARTKIDQGKMTVNGTVTFPMETADDLYREYPRIWLYYAPNDTFTTDLMQKVRVKLQVPSNLMQGFASETDLVDHFHTITLNQSDYTDVSDTSAVIFKSDWKKSLGKLDYKIRMTARELQDVTGELIPQVALPGPNRQYLLYTQSGFVALQMAVDTSFIETVSAGQLKSPINFFTQQFPYPPFVSDPIFDLIYKLVFPIVTYLSIFIVMSNAIKRVVEEKQTGVKELMKLMGLPAWMIWMSWMLNVIIVIVPAIIGICICIFYPFNAETGAVLTTCNPLVFFTFLLLFYMATVCFAFAISTFFNKPAFAVNMGYVACIFSHTLPNQLLQSGATSLRVKVLLCLFPNAAMSMGFRNMAGWASRDTTLTFGNLFESAYASGSDLSMGGVFVMFVVSMAFFMLITWYMDNVRPGEFGLARPFYFPMTKSYWIPSRVDSVSQFDEINEHRASFEPPPANVQPGIRVRNIRKRFGEKIAIENLSLDIYKKEITALLGHNGAGKTTLMSILTGLFSPTKGTAYVDGYDIRTHIDEIRDSLGLCPQHNMLFTDLNVYEHLLFFAMLKGCTRAEANHETQDLFNKLNLGAKKYEMCSSLSGGMKRKLSLAISLIGKTKVLILDEPTSGMDPEARRKIWDLLLSMRGERTIIITTHFMEEADVLGDRIAIMDHGVLQCYGSSLFLKKLYGAGYQLSLISRTPENLKRISAAVQGVIPTAQLKTQSGALVSYLLPTNTTGKFSQLFNELESRKAELNIDSIGLSLTTLEEVFLKVGQLAGTEPVALESEQISNESGSIYGETDALGRGKLRGMELFMHHCEALVRKRMIFSIRKKLLLLLEIVIPMAITIALMVLVSGSNKKSDTEPIFTYDLKAYGENTVFYGSDAGEASAVADFYAQGINPKYLTRVPNVSEALIKSGTENIVHYRELTIVAGEFVGNVDANAMYSSIATHALPISVNLVTNAALRFYKDATGSITTALQPLQKQTKHDLEYLSMFVIYYQAFMWILLLPLGLTFLTGSFMNFPLTERTSNAKQLQLMTGLHWLVYWFTCFVWDFIVFVLVATLMTACVWIFDSKGTFSSANELVILWTLLVLYGLAAIPLVYLISHWFKTFAGAFSLYSVVCSLLSIIGVVVVTTMKELKYDHYKLFKYGFALFPHYTMMYSVTSFAIIALSNNECKYISPEFLSIKCDDDPKYKCCARQTNPSDAFLTGDDGFGDMLLVQLVNFVVYTALIALVETKMLPIWFDRAKVWLYARFYNVRATTDRNNPDVVGEHDRVDGVFRSQSPNQEDVLLARNLEKIFKRFVAVKGVSFGVKHSECFGLLGVNGAGKTTTFRMLTGDEIPTNGCASINGYDLNADKNEYLSQIGYCPQFNGFNEQLTGREMLQVFAKLRGISKKALNAEVNRWLAWFGLNEYADSICGRYSGGNQRKLSAAIAMIGDPVLVLLDEPTSGVDPISRRNLWDVLAKIKKSGTSIVLTSHSMEECEALCDRLAIMVNGQFQCVGEVQYLKHKYGQGFTLALKLNNDSTSGQVDQLRAIVEGAFECQVKDQHEGFVQYHINEGTTTWRKIFDTMESTKERYANVLEDYTVSETTLEQVFLAFAKTQQ